ncbi:hypothetical protein GCWU000325_01563 [Alloprevotella tannerae ATCC 51259]|uniref:Uncharacterized protein n=1 Tax=Alloprevotella tannerae ATCC 51259 TaxID=626522 RepID=C9LH62_9BACT|nr:hypothetical protein GCWU000325_01563 [Alloprevotella tannerae ATCC 51259]
MAAQLSAGKKLHLIKAAFSTDESAVFFVFCRKWAVDLSHKAKDHSNFLL